MTDRPAISGQITFLLVADLERSHRFYSDTLGLEMVLDQGSCRIYSVVAGAYLGLCERPAQVTPGGILLTLVSPVDAWHRRLTDAGVDVVQAPQHSEGYRVYHAFYRDPDGHILEIQEFDDPEWAAPHA